MTAFSEYQRHDGVGLAELVRSKAVEPLELVEAAIDRIEQANPSLNAVVHPLYDDARRRAQTVRRDGPFAGVPLLLKDLLAAYAGAPFTSGSRYFADFRPGRSSALVERFEAAGFIVVGKTNTPELGLLPVTEPELFGPTRNPWDRAHSPGGSSGGSAAAVAAAMVPIASGGDGGGSIRIPASCTGLFGLKPTRGRVPLGPYVSESWAGFSVEHVITRSVRDSAAVLDATHGHAPGQAFRENPPWGPFSAELGKRPDRMRIAFSADPVLGTELHPDCRTALEDACALLRQMGHELVEAAPVVDVQEFKRDYTTLIAADVAATIRQGHALVGRRATHRDYEPATRLLGSVGEATSAGRYVAARLRLNRVGGELEEFMKDYDAWLTPTLGSPPPLVGELLSKGLERTAERLTARLRLGWLAEKSGELLRSGQRIFDFIPFTPLANASGQPSMSVPLFWNAQNLPIGVLFTGRFGDEAALFRLAAQLEEARPWFDRRPPQG